MRVGSLQALLMISACQYVRRLVPVILLLNAGLCECWSRHLPLQILRPLQCLDHHCLIQPGLKLIYDAIFLLDKCSHLPQLFLRGGCLFFVISHFKVRVSVLLAAVLPSVKLSLERSDLLLKALDK